VKEQRNSGTKDRVVSIMKEEYTKGCECFPDL